MIDNTMTLVRVIDGPDGEAKILKRNGHQERRELRDALRKANLAAKGDSNDGEIDNLREALELALSRWPGLNLGGNRHRCRRKDVNQDGYCDICGEYA